MSYAVLMKESMAGKLRAAEAKWGWLDLVVLEGEKLLGVCGFSLAEDLDRHFGPGEFQDHRLFNGREVRRSGVWYRGRDDIPFSLLREDASRRRGALSVDTVKEWLTGGWREPPRAQGFPVLIEDRSDRSRQWTAWWADPIQVVPAELIAFDPVFDPFVALEGLWPRTEAASAHVVVVGVGSIGSVAASVLAEYGIGQISLLDPDRIEPHNLVRHQCGVKDIGRFKVDAVADRLRDKPGVGTVVPHRLDVVHNANIIRGILKTADVAVVCTDGVASRQAGNHLVRWAGLDSVFACVLEDGALGEIVRLLYQQGVGCLWCHRRALRDADQLDPEPGLDLGYGTGTTHRPMTAVGGDLHLMGTLAAKCAIATLLERRGFREHRLVGDHLVIGLQPQNPYAAPFDVDSVIRMSPRALPPPNPECPACAASPLHAPS